MEAGTGLADHRFVGAMRIAWRNILGDPVLHVQARPWAFEENVAHSARLLAVRLLASSGKWRVDLDQMEKNALKRDEIGCIVIAL